MLAIHRFQRGLTPIPRISPHPTHVSAQGHHVASLAGFTTWVNVQAPGLFTTGNPSTGGNSTDARLSDLVSHLNREFGAFVKV